MQPLVDDFICEIRKMTIKQEERWLKTINE